MKRQTLFMCIVFLLFSSIATAQSEPGDSSKNASAVNVSEIFSKQFVLPEVYIMNTFSFEVPYVVFADKSVRVDDIKIASNITKRAVGSPSLAGFSHNSIKASNSDLLSAIRDWFTANGDVLLQTVVDFEFEDSIPLVTQVYYSPILYAQSGDTLFCTGDLENEYLSEGEEAGTYYDYYIRNHRNTPYYAVVRRSRNNVTLLVHEREMGKLFNMVSYHIQSADLVAKNGNQMYLGEDGKRIRIKQVWKDDKLVSAETYNSENRVESRYEFQYPARLPKLKKKEVLYPNGSVKVCTEYEKDDIIVTAYNEDGSKAKYVPAKGVEKAINAYFKKNFDVPAIGNEYRGINYMDLKLDITCTIDESGAIRIVSRNAPTAKWSYNFKAVLISPAQINSVINREYSPYYREFWKALCDQSFVCTPAKVNGKPLASKATIHIEHNFTPKYTNKQSDVSGTVDNELPMVDVNPTDSIKQQNDDDVVFVVVEQMPEFPGGQAALSRFLSENVKYPTIAKENNIQGRVLCQFVVEKDGTITDVTVVKSGGDASLDKEAVRVLRMMPKWKPGIQRGKPVRVKYTVPVNFRLQRGTSF